MNEDELRKSVRRQKFERQGLTLPTTTTPTGSSSPSQSQVSFSFPLHVRYPSDIRTLFSDVQHNR